MSFLVNGITYEQAERAWNQAKVNLQNGVKYVQEWKVEDRITEQQIRDVAVVVIGDLMLRGMVPNVEEFLLGGAVVAAGLYLGRKAYDVAKLENSQFGRTTRALFGISPQAVDPQYDRSRVTAAAAIVSLFALHMTVPAVADSVRMGVAGGLSVGIVQRWFRG